MGNSPQVKPPRTTQDPCGILCLRAATRQARRRITVELVVSGRINDRVVWTQARELRPAHLLAARQNDRSARLIHRRRLTGVARRTAGRRARLVGGAATL